MLIQTKIIELNQSLFYKSSGVQTVSFIFEADVVISVDLHWQSINSHGKTQPKFCFNPNDKLLSILVPVGLVEPRSYIEVAFSSLSYIRDEKINKIIGDE